MARGLMTAEHTRTGRKTGEHAPSGHATPVWVLGPARPPRGHRDSRGMNAVLDGFKALGFGRLLAMGGVAAVDAGDDGIPGTCVAAGPTGCRLLYSDIDLREASQIVDLLDKAHIAHDSQGDGSRIMVPGVRYSPCPLVIGQRRPADRRLDRIRDFRPRRRPDRQPVPANHQPDPRDGGRTRPQHPHDRRASRRSGCIWCCLNANPSPATGRKRRPAWCSP